MKRFNMIRKAAAVALSAAMVLSLGACGSSTATVETDTTTAAQGSGESTEGETQQQDGYVMDTLKVGTSKDAGTFDPFISSNWGSVDINYYQCLAITDSTGKLYNEILKNYEKIDDLTYSLEIWDCVYDSEGTPITIDDVIWCYNHLTETGNGGGIKKISEFEKTGDYTCNMKLSEKFVAGDLEKYLSNVKIVSQATYEKAGDMTSKPIGTGPYVLEEYSENSKVVFSANEDWWFLKVRDQIADEDIAPTCRQNFKTIEFDIIQEASSRAIALEMGTVDVVDSLDQADIDSLSANSDFSLIDVPVTPPVIFIMNASEDSPLQSLELRQAVCYALDNAAIADGLGLPAQACYGLQPNAVDAPESWTTGEGREWYSYDLEKAKELVKESGYDGSTLKIMYESSVAFDATALMMVSALDEIGVSVELESVEHMVYENDMYFSDAWDMRLVNMGGGMYLSQLTKGYWTEDDTEHLPDMNYSMVSDDKLDELYVALRDDNSEANIEAWDEYFEQQIYAYSICTYSSQTICSSKLQNNYISDRSRLLVASMTLAQ